MYLLLYGTEFYVEKMYFSQLQYFLYELLRISKKMFLRFAKRSVRIAL